MGNAIRDYDEQHDRLLEQTGMNYLAQEQESTVMMMMSFSSSTLASPSLNPSVHLF